MPVRMRFLASRPAQWEALVVLAALVTVAMQWLNVTGANFLGPMVAALAFGCSGARIRLPVRTTAVSQSVVGCVLARSLDWELLLFTARHAAAILFVVTATAAIGAAIAWALFRFTSMDRDTAIWGSVPGAASVMVAFAAELGGDVRIVAFMQFARAIFVISTVAMVLSVIGGSPHHAALAPVAAAADGSVFQFCATILIAATGFMLSRFVPLPAGALLFPTMIGAVFHLEGWLTLAVPTFVQVGAVALLGTYVGLQFDRIVLAQAIRNLPAILLSIVSLMISCGAFGLILARLLGIDPLTGYLATSPGGIDSIAVLGLGSSADMSIVMAVQTIRFFGVILLAPYLAALIRARLITTES